MLEHEVEITMSLSVSRHKVVIHPASISEGRAICYP
jgi:hypothetical protein